MDFREFVENYWVRNKSNDAPFYVRGNEMRIEFDKYIELIAQCEKEGTEFIISKPRVSWGYTLEGKMYRNWRMLNELKEGKKVCLLTPDKYVEKYKDEFYRFTGEEINIENVDGNWVVSLKN